MKSLHARLFGSFSASCLLALVASVWPCPPVASAQPVSDAVAGVIRRTAPPPRLVVVLSIDQFRADYLTRLADLYLPAMTNDQPGGFRYLMERSAWFTNAQFEHYPLFTAPGHAVLLSGAHPYKSGIVSNEWWDPQQLRVVYCVEAPGERVVGAGEKSTARPMGPRNFRASTIGDELKRATNGRSKVVALSIKDRSAILMAGHVADTVIWFDTGGGSWISSSAYCHNGQLPAWVSELNSRKIPDQSLGTSWNPLLTAEQLAAWSRPPAIVGKDWPKSFSAAFPHTLGIEQTKDNYRAFIFTPAANAMLFDAAAHAISAEHLGQDEVPDVLAISLSTNDYVGHAMGPYSPEAVDLAAQTDRQLSSFLQFVQHQVPGGLGSVLFVLSADHGVTPTPEQSDLDHESAGRFSVSAVLDTLEKGLTARFGPPPDKTWLAHKPGAAAAAGAYLDGFISLDQPSIAHLISKGIIRSRRDVEQVACDAIADARLPGVYACYGRTQILENQLPATDITRHLSKGVDPARCSDLILVQMPMFLDDSGPEGHATSHGTPYAYDTHVPIMIAWPGVIRPAVYADPVGPADIAPTLALLLGIEKPSACEGTPLLPSLR